MGFYTGNVVKNEDGELFVVGQEKRTLIPFNATNCIVGPPEEDVYKTVRVYDKMSDDYTYKKQLMMKSIKSYEYVASNINEYLITRFKVVLGLK